jgi:hypothetical protein
MTLPDDLGAELYALVLSKQSTGLLKELNEALLVLERGVALERLDERYGLSPDRRDR